MSVKIRRILTILISAIVLLIAIYFVMKITTPKNCMVPLNRMSQDCKDFIYPE